jgi:hypothetical protein
MTAATFLTRIESGKVNNLIYSTDGKEGLVSVWKHEGAYVLTWEECNAGDQYDESNYTRDERCRFEAAEQLLGFLKDHALKLEAFKP